MKQKKQIKNKTNKFIMQQKNITIVLFQVILARLTVQENYRFWSDWYDLE